MENQSASISWLDREITRFKERGMLIPERQNKLYHLISREWTAGRTVIDIGCSAGVGSNILSHNARMVWGIDVNEEAIRYATQAYKRPNLDFAVFDIENPPMRELGKFEVVVVSEIMEHLANLDAGLGTVKRFFLDKIGTMGFITCPNQNNAEVRENEAKHGYHIQKWTAGQFYELMINNFKSVVMYSVDKLNTWSGKETVDGNSEDYLLVCKVEGAK